MKITDWLLLYVLSRYEPLLIVCHRLGILSIAWSIDCLIYRGILWCIEPCPIFSSVKHLVATSSAAREAYIFGPSLFQTSSLVVDYLSNPCTNEWNLYRVWVSNPQSCRLNTLLSSSTRLVVLRKLMLAWLLGSHYGLWFELSMDAVPITDYWLPCLLRRRYWILRPIVWIVRFQMATLCVLTVWRVQVVDMALWPISSFPLLRTFGQNHSSVVRIRKKGFQPSCTRCPDSCPLIYSATI